MGELANSASLPIGYFVGDSRPPAFVSAAQAAVLADAGLRNRQDVTGTGRLASRSIRPVAVNRADGVLVYQVGTIDGR